MAVLLKPVTPMNMGVKSQFLCSHVLIPLFTCYSWLEYLLCLQTHSTLPGHFKLFRSQYFCGYADRVSLPAHLSGTPESDAAPPCQHLGPHPQLLCRFSRRQPRIRDIYTSPKSFSAIALLFPQYLLQRPMHRLFPPI